MTAAVAEDLRALNDGRVRLTYTAAQQHMFFDSAELGRFRLFPKGRRLGFTRGAGQAVIEYCLEGKSVMWGDTTATNIDRYFRRYIRPVLRSNGIPYRYRKVDKELIIGDGHVDFRSADRPENWEGFGYDVIILNEAGIILDDRYLYENAVLPMLIDSPNSTLIAGGTPKLRQGKGRLYRELCDKADRGEPGYHVRRFSTYDNPFLALEDIRLLAEQIPQHERAQEVDGLFLEPGGTVVQREWLRKGKPDNLNLCQVGMGVDLAITMREIAKTKNKDPDYTAIVVKARDEHGNRYTLDAQRRRIGFHQVLEFIKEMAATWGPQAIKIEANQYQVAVVQEMLRTTELPVSPYVAVKDKLMRAGKLIRRYEQGLEFHDPALPPEFTDEVLAFGLPHVHDDQVDAAVLADEAIASIPKGEYFKGASSDPLSGVGLGGDLAGY